MSNESNSTATMVGVTARETMAAARFEGRVVAAVSNAVYIKSGSGELFG